MDRKNIGVGLLWLWVAIAMAAYLYQFQGFVQPILQYLGIA